MPGTVKDIGTCFRCNFTLVNMRLHELTFTQNFVKLFRPWIHLDLLCTGSISDKVYLLSRLSKR